MRLHPLKSCDSELFNGYNLVSLAAIFFDFMAIFKNRCISQNRDENKTKIVNSFTGGIGQETNISCSRVLQTNKKPYIVFLVFLAEMLFFYMMLRSKMMQLMIDCFVNG